MATNIVVRFVGETASLQRAFALATADTAKFKAATSSLSTGLAGAAATTMHWGRTLSMATIPLAFAGGAAVKMALDYEDSINKMTRLAGVSKEQAARWAREIKEVSTNLAVGPQELAEALYFVASSGVPVERAMSVVVAAARGAAIGLGDVQVVADALTSVINVYGAENISAAEALDVLTAAVREGKGEADQYARVIGRLTPNAALLGVKFNEVGAAMAFLTNNGLSTAEAATRLNQVFQNIVKPAKQSVDTITMLGGSYDEVRKIIKEKGLLEALRYMRWLTKGNDEAFARMFPNVRSLNAALLLTAEEGAPQANEIFGELKDNSNDTNSAFERTANTTKFKLNKALAGLKVIGTEIGERILPLVGKMADKFSLFAKSFNGYSDSTKDWISKIGFAVMMLGPAILGVSLILKGLAFLTSPLGATSLAIVGLVLGAIWLYQNWKPFQNFVDQKLVPALERLRDYLAVKLPQGIENLKTVWNDPSAFDNDSSASGQLLRAIGRLREVWDVVQRDFPKGIENIKAAWNDPSVVDGQDGLAASFLRGLGMFNRGWQQVPENFRRGIDQIKSYWHTSGLEGFFGRSVDVIAGLFRYMTDSIVSSFNIFKGIFTTDWDTFWDGVTGLVAAQWNWLTEIVSAAFTGIWNLVKFIGRNLWDTVDMIFGGILRTVVGFVFRIASTVGNMWDGITGGLVAAYNTVVWLFALMWNKVTEFANNVWRGAQMMWAPVAEALRAVVRSVIIAWNALDFTIDVTIPDWVPFLGGRRFYIADVVPDIPQPFARGGIISGPTLALMGEGYRKEVVFPTNDPERGYSLLAAAGVHAPSSDGGGGTVIHYSPNFVLMNPSDAARINEREMAWLMKTNGR